uniref:Uncharacterized protein n=1 Tax=Anguilla anguilla TaxID=7936 RepID=A0A0E9WGT2_ANGAN
MCIHAMLTFPSYYGEEGFFVEISLYKERMRVKSISALCEIVNEWSLINVI